MSKIQQSILTDLVERLSSAGFSEVRLPQANLMSAIGVDRPVRMGELARRLRLTQGAVTQLVGPLEQSGLVQRRRDPGDGRGVVVELTERALEGYRIAVRMTEERYQAWRGLVGNTDWETFQAVLAAILEHEEARGLGVRNQAPPVGRSAQDIST
jgi:DNA-binding MarR family transcriptional regulator